MEEFKVKNELAKFKTTSAIEQYFKGILDVSKSGAKFPINLDDEWAIAYERRDNAIRALKREFMVDEDYIIVSDDSLLLQNEEQTSELLLRQNEEQKTGRGGHNKQMYFLSVPCLEFFVAHKVRQVFEVYRQVFHRVAQHVQQMSQIERMDLKLKMIEAGQRMLRLSDGSVAKMLNQLNAEVGAPMIDYISFKGVLKAPSILLKQIGSTMSAKEFNILLAKAGYIEQMVRPGSKGKEHKYWVITDMGLEYGENYRYSEDELGSQPHWYEKTFKELYSIVVPQQEFNFNDSDNALT